MYTVEVINMINAVTHVFLRSVLTCISVYMEVKDERTHQF
jgi:hypothetical protein